MKQGVLTNTRVRLLLKEGHSCYRARRAGERKRKSVRGCIVGPDLSVLNLVIVKKGDSEVEGLTDSSVPKRLGPKRASKIRKLFNLNKTDDIRKYVISRTVEKKNGKKDVKVRYHCAHAFSLFILVLPFLCHAESVVGMYCSL
ncbi:hypothetical protein EON65_42240 [archaeon]|nr:MAG: hypothetical protein EON65_42240 [archaeon]